MEGFIWVNQLKEGIDPNNPNDINLELARIDWQDVSKDIEAYPVHDMLFDRQGVWKWYLNEVRPWLNKPFPAEFLAMMEKYYSFRNVRRHPGAEFFLELQWKLGQHWKDWYGYEENITSADMEKFTHRMEELNLISRERGKRLMDKLLGSPVSRGARQLGQLDAESARQTVGSPGWWLGSAWDGLWTLMKYIATGK